MGSIPALRKILEVARNHHLRNTPESIHAEKLLVQLIAKDKAKERLDTLCNSGDSNAVLENADELLAAIENAKSYGVDVSAVGTAEKYYERVKILLPIRNKMRVAVESASRRMILEALEERREFCKVYGRDFCREELNAMKNMLRMFSFEIQLKGGDKISAPPADIMLQASRSKSMAAEDDGTTESVISNDLSSLVINDVRLPKWAFEHLIHIQNCEDRSEKDFELRQFEKCLGSAEKTREIRRAYKWVCQFSTWRHPDHEAMVLKKHEVNFDDDEKIHTTVKSPPKFVTLKKENLASSSPNNLMSGSALRDKSVRKMATPRQKRGPTSPASSGYGNSSSKFSGSGKKLYKDDDTRLPKAERKINEMMKEYSAFYDTHRIPLDWCP